MCDQHCLVVSLAQIHPQGMGYRDWCKKQSLLIKLGLSVYTSLFLSHISMINVRCALYSPDYGALRATFFQLCIEGYIGFPLLILGESPSALSIPSNQFLLKNFELLLQKVIMSGLRRGKQFGGKCLQIQ